MELIRRVRDFGIFVLRWAAEGISGIVVSLFLEICFSSVTNWDDLCGTLFSLGLRFAV